MTIHKEGYSSIALCILFIFVLNAIVQYLRNVQFDKSGDESTVTVQFNFNVN